MLDLSSLSWRTLIVVPAEYRAQANAAAAQMSGNPADAETFGRVGLVPVGGSTVTHYACCAALTPENRVAVEGMRSAFPGAIVLHYNLETTPEAALQALRNAGLEVAREGI